MKRPGAVELGALLLAAAIVMTLAVAFTTPTGDMPGVIIISSEIGFGAFVLSVIETLVVVAFYNGMNWARTAVAVVSFLWLISTAFVPWMWVFSKSAAVLAVYKGVVALYLLVLLLCPGIRNWFLADKHADTIKPST